MSPILKKDTILDISHQLSNNGESIVFTHGSFDLCHVGHTTFLKESKKKGDFLIVGIESDSRIQTYKGVKRPIVPLEERLRVIADLTQVDFVFPIDEGDLNNKFYLSLYESLGPEIVTFGRLFQYKSKLEKREKLNTKIKFQEVTHKFDKLQSTTNLIEKIKKGS